MSNLIPLPAHEKGISQDPPLPDQDLRLAEFQALHQLDKLTAAEQDEYLALLQPLQTHPSLPANDTAVPKGPRTKIDLNQEPAAQQSLMRENEAAGLLAQAGYDVEQNPNVRGSKNPDYLIEGKVFDCYAPSNANPRSIWSAVKKKIDTRQTQRIILNLDDSSVDVIALRSQFAQFPIPNLQEVMLIQNGQISHLLP